MRQFVITPAAGKRLIGKALAAHPVVESAIESGTIAIIAGTTNGYVAEEVLAVVGQNDDFSRRGFFRGVTSSPSIETTESGRLRNEDGFPGDVIITDGVWRKGKTIFDVADEMIEGDIILKGANALDLVRRQAAILIGDPNAGTIGRALQAVLGRRVRLILPVGLEKRVSCDLYEIANRIDAPGCQGKRLLPVPGEVFTEIDALSLLTGVCAELFAAGGVGGAEGSVWLLASGSEEQLDAAEKIIRSVSSEIGIEIAKRRD
ncbi:MAG: hypothetical protein JW986_03615 [Methanotrichaceae archaeon]|nr:hypothetical protein [Methanotrichaceae archaeon]